MTGPWAVVPVKAFGSAKARLAGRCPPGLRAALARAMAVDVLSALSQAAGLAGIAVVTDDAEVADLAARYGARALPDEARDGHTGAVSAAFARLRREGVPAALTIPGDVPGVTPAEIEALLAALGTPPSMVIAPAHDERGSNAIALSPPDAIPLAFGDDSFGPHLAAARARGIKPRVLRLPGIGLDIDRPADLDLLLERPATTRAQALLTAWADRLTPDPDGETRCRSAT